jgi:23S rRNA (adenine2503-C2)-methyltransferase
MYKKDQDRSIIGMNLEELEKLVIELGLEKFRAKQIFKWVYSKSCRNWSEMSDLSKNSREILEKSNIKVGSLDLLDRQISQDGTQKFLFRLETGEYIESVLMRFQDRDSLSVCISSQVGCAVACPFCATGAMGFKKNLSSNQIIEQLLFIQNLVGERVSNIVYMGQGEPLLNYEAVLESIYKFRDLVGIGLRHITLSTSGIVPAINKLAEEGLQITLALSLHDPEDSGRDFLVPINRKYPIKELMEALQNYYKKTKRRLTIEYILIDNLNDTESKAKALGELLKDLHCNINLIPYNQTQVKDPFRRSTKEKIKVFSSLLCKFSRNKTITIRHEKGHDIAAACGQLANKA